MFKKTDTAMKNPGMGAILGARGVTFRVWAPHAEKVYVTGTFNDWSKTSTPLAHEGKTDGLPCSGKISIGPYTVVIYSQDVWSSV